MKINKIKMIIFLNAILLSLSGCISMKNFDYFMYFQVELQIMDENNISINEAKIYFIDLGIDPTCKHQRCELFIGETKETGKINLLYKYWWGQKRRSFWPIYHSKKPDYKDANFLISVRKDNYEEKQTQFCLSKIPKKENIYYLRDNIILVKTD